MATATITFPDGSTKSVTAPSREEAIAQAQQLAASFAPKPDAGTTGRAVTAGMGEQLLGNLAGTLNLPTRAINYLTSAGDAIGSKVDQMMPSALMDSGLFPKAAPTPQIPEIPVPTGRQLASGIEAPVQAAMSGQSIPDAYGARMDFRNQMAQDRPIATTAGNVLGDVVTLMSARAPMMAGRTGGAFDQAVSNGVSVLQQAANPERLTRGARHALSTMIDSKGFRSLAQGLGRAAESGIEGFTLGALHDADPVEIASISAGSQLAASAGNVIAEHMFGPVGNRSLTSLKGWSILLGGMAALQYLKTVTPGGNDSPLDSLKASFTKVAAGGLLGFTLGLAGRRGSMAGLGQDFPKLADSLAAIPRAGIIRLAEAATKDPQMEQVINNAPALGKTDANKMTELLKSDDPVKAIQGWMDNNKRVRNLLLAPDPRLAGVPVREEDK